MADDAKQKALTQIEALRSIFKAYAEASEAGIKALDVLQEAVGQWPGDTPPPPPPDEVDLERGRLFHGENIATPVDLPAGAFDGAKMVLAVVKLRTTTGRYQKIIGAASSKAFDGAFCIGLKADGSWNIWRYNEKGSSNEIKNVPALPARKGSLLVWACDAGAQTFQLDTLPPVGQAVTEPLAPIDGVASVGQGFWRGNRVDPIDGEILAIDVYARLLSAAEHQAWVDQHEHLIDDEPDPGNGEPPPPPPPPPPGDGLEPVTSAVQVTAEVGTTKHASWHGFGWGANGWADAKANEGLVDRHAKLLFEDLNVKVLRIWTPEDSAGCVNAYKRTWQIAKAHGVDTVIASGFYWRRKNEGKGSSPEAFAEGVARTDEEIPLDWIDPQNEPDGNPKNAAPANEIADVYRRIRARLDALGKQKIKLAGLAWAHAGSGAANQEFDLLDAAGLVPKAVAAGGGHLYSDCGRPSNYRDRWAKRGCGMIYSETGNLGLPNGIARSISALTHGGIMEVVHIGLVGAANPTGEPAAQGLVYGGGARAPSYRQYETVFKNLPRGTVFRRVTMSDTFAGANAREMIRSPGKNPRLQMACGQTPDGDLYLVAVNTTKGAGEQSIYAGSCAPAATLQVTMRIAELTGVNGRLLAARCNQSGAPQEAREYSVVDGITRFTLGPGELIVMQG